jgi:hypothetical protein
MIDDAVVASVVKTTKKSEAVVRAVLTALENAMSGDPVGTVVQDPSNGSIAVRVAEDGVPVWKVTSLSGKEYRDAQPTLKGWTVISEVK